MKTIRSIILAVSLVLSVHLLHAQVAPFGISNNNLGPVQSATPDPADSIVQLTADAQGLQLLSPDQVPFVGTFWTIVPGSFSALPFPCQPLGYNLPTYVLPDGTFLVDDTATTNAVTQADLEAQATAVVNLIGQVQKVAAYQQSLMMAHAMDSGIPSPGGDPGDAGGGVPLTATNNPVIYGTNLWLEITSLSNVWVNLLVSNTLADVQYEIDGTTNLAPSQWNFEGFFFGSELTNWTTTSIAAFKTTTNLFLRVKSWAGDASSLPIWWQLQYFGTTGVDPYGNPAGDGYSNLYKFQHGMNPNTFYAPVLTTFNAAPTASGNGVLVTWNPAQGAVTGYTIYRNGSAIATVAASQLSYLDSSTSIDLTDPNDSDFPTYGVQANYAEGSFYAGTQDPVNTNYFVVTGIARGAQGRYILLVPNIPQNVVTVRIYPQGIGDTYPNDVFNSVFGFYQQPEYGFAPALNGTYFDVPTSDFTNGQYIIPVAQMPYYGDYNVICRALDANNDPGPASSAYNVGQPVAEDVDLAFIPFLDATEQIKENAVFQLETADKNGAFSFTVNNPYGNPTDVSFPPNYVYAGFLFPYDYGSPYFNYAFLDPFKPFEDNYFYRNFVYANTNLNTDGSLASGVYYDASSFPPIQIPNLTLFSFPEFDFVSTGNTNDLQPQMSATANQWLYTAYEPASPSQGNIGISKSGTNLFLNGGKSNVFGLTYQSAKRIYGNGTLHTDTLNSGGGSIPDVGYPEYFYGQVTPPQLQPTGYFFAIPNQDYLPGHAGFNPNNPTNSMMVTAVAQSLQVGAWAKEQLVNGASGKTAYVQQYFDKAYLADSNGNFNTNTPTGILSEYGEFFPTAAGKTFLTTKPVGTNQGLLAVNTFALAADVNHDGVIDTTFGGPDFTTAAHPFRFWVNNGYDGVGGDFPVEGATPPNYSLGTITCPRDLENFARLWICGMPSLTNNWQVTLSWANVSSGNPGINLYNSVETNGGTGYLTDTNIAAMQSTFTITGGSPPAYSISGAGATIGRLTNGVTLIFQASYFTNGGNYHFLFEGSGVGSGELALTLSDGSGNPILQTGLWLDLHDIKDFYEMARATNVTSTVPPSSLISQFQPLKTISAAPNETKQMIVFVHGINNTDFNVQDSAETMYKRLYWSGYNGRLAAFRWPCGYLPFENTWYPFEYNESEFWAYKSAPAFKGYLNFLRNRPDLSGYEINIIAHSQGNAVASEALSEGAPFDNYILTQGAVPAHCYDGNAPALQVLLNAEAATPTPYAAPIGGYNQCWANISGNLIDYYNTNDFALASGTTLGLQSNWVANQAGYKPEAFAGGPSYIYYPSNHTAVAYYNFSSYTVTDFQESRSMVARSRTSAVGAQGGLGGVLNSSASVDLLGTFGFGKTREEHSAEFSRPIQTVWGYYDQVLRSFRIQPITR